MHTPIEFFKGLASGQVKAPPDTAKSLQNVCTFRKMGQLEAANGIASLGLPTFPTPTLLSGSVTWRDLFSFKAATDTTNGDQTFYVLAGSFSRHKVTGGGTVSCTSLFVTPYFDSAGTLVTTGWQEVTEFYVAQFASASGSNIVLNAATGSGSLPANDYFNGWTVIHKGDWTDVSQNYFRVTDWTLTSPDRTLTIYGSAASATSTWSGNDEVYICRSLQARTIPNSVVSEFRALYDEARWTTGNNATDLDMGVAYKSKTFGWSETIKGMLGFPGVHEYNSRAFGVTDMARSGGDETKYLPEGSWSVRCSLLMDDNQETELRELGATGTIEPVTAVFTDSTTETVRDFVVTTDGAYYVLTRTAGGLTKIGRAAAGGAYWWYTLPADYLGTNIVLIDYATEGSVVDVIGKYTSGGTNYAFAWAFYGQASKWVSGTQSIGVATYSLGATNAVVDNSDLNIGTSRSLSFGSGAAPLTSATFGSYNSMPAGYLVYGTSGTWKVLAFFPGVGFLDYLPAFSTAATAPDYGCGLYAVDPTNKNISGFNGQVAYFLDDDVIYYMNTALTWASYTLTSRNHQGIAATPDYLFVGTDAGEIVRCNLSADTVIYTGDQTGANGVKSVSIGPDSGPVFTSYQTVYWTTPTGTLNDSAAISEEMGLKVSLTGGAFLSLSIGTSPEVIYQFTVYSALTSNFVMSGSEHLTMAALVNPGAIPARAKKLRIWLDKDGEGYYATKEVDLLTGTWTATYSTDLLTIYAKSTSFEITKNDWEAAVTLASAALGRDKSDDGVIRYTGAVTVGNRVAAFGVRLDGVIQRNKVFISAIGTAQHYDAFPNDVANLLDVDYNDGDDIMAIAPMGDRLLVIKKNSVVVLTPLGDGSWSRDMVSQRVGTVAKKSVQVWDDIVYFLDDRQVVQYSGRGLDIISDGKIQDSLIAASTSDKAAAISTVDRENYLYRLQIGANVWVWDVRAGDWFKDVPPAPTEATSTLPAAYCYSPATLNYVMLCTPTGGTPIAYKQSEGTDFNGVDLSWFWESSDQLTNVGGLYDIVVRGLSVECEVTGTLTIALRLNGSSSDFVSRTVASGVTRGIWLVPFNRCKRFSVRLSGTVASTETFKVKSVHVFYDVLPTLKTQ
jgi:hypothetical protein